MFTDPDSQESYIDYDNKPEFTLQTWMGDNRYENAAQMYITDEEWEKLKTLKEPLQNRIVECYKDDNKRWRYMRFRDDKDNGNHVGTYKKVMTSIEDGVTKRELIQACAKIRENWKKREADRKKRDEARRHDEARRRAETRRREHPNEEVSSDHRRTSTEGEPHAKRQRGS